MQNNESRLQSECVRWWNLQFPKYYGLLFAVPNGGKRNVVTARIQKGEGVIAGVADLILLIPNMKYHGLCIEMKFGKNRQSDNQVWWQGLVQEQGYAYIICNSFDRFREVVSNYINNMI